MAALPVDGSQDIHDKMKRTFREWDVDNSGTISRAELAGVLQKLAGWDAPTVTTLMDGIDKNMDGALSYDEFVAWLLNPASTSTIDSDATTIAKFDLSSALKPLFRVYDRDGSGFIKLEEFEECHCMLQGALKMHPTEKGAADPTIATKSITELFAELDADHNHVITLDEFVAWQMKVIEQAGIPNCELTELVNKLVETLEEIFRMDKEAEAGCGDDDPRMLQHLSGLIEKLASTERQLWSKSSSSKGAEVDHEEYTNHWTEPPVGLSLERLIRFHMSDVPVRTYRLKKCTAEVRLCLPERPQDVDESRGRIWYAKLLRTVTTKSDSAPHSEFFYYMFHDLKWRRLAQEEKQHYYSARDSMAPEVRMFCLLKAEANMGVKLDWRGVQEALADGVELQLITIEDIEKYNKEMLSFAMGIVQEEGNALTPAELDAAGREMLKTKVNMPPRHVMAGLSEFGIMKPSPVWAQFMEDAAPRRPKT